MEDKTADREVTVAEYLGNGETLVLTDERYVGADATLRVQESVVADGGLFLEIAGGTDELNGCVWLTPLQVELLLDFIEDKELGL